MSDAQRGEWAAELADGRTDRVCDLLEDGCSAKYEIDGVSLIQHCAYYGDVSAIRFLLSRGESLESLGQGFGLNGAAFHGHWRLCQFLLEQGADANQRSEDTGETPLHSTLCTADRIAHDRVLEVLLQHGADPNVATKPGIETGGFMRDCRTKGETPLHRAGAFGDGGTIQMLLDAGAVVDAKDINGDSPLTWASWYLRPAAILRQLCYGDFRINSANTPMRANLIGKPIFRT